MASIKTSALYALAAVSALGTWNAPAADTGSVEERLKKLETQVEGLQKENASLKKELGYDPKSPAAFVREAGKGSKMTLGGFLQGQAEFGKSPDARFDGIEDRFLLRRARLNVQGSFLENFDYKAEMDIGANSISEQTSYRAQLTDMFVNWNRYEYANLKIGQYKTHYGYEQIASDTKILTVERSLPNDRLTDGRQIGSSLTGAVLEKRLSYALGVFNGTSVNNSFNDNDQFMYVGRVQGTVLKTDSKDWGVEWNAGANALISHDGSVSKGTSVSKSGFGFDSVLGGAVDNGFIGNRSAWGADTQVKVGPFDVQAEYLRSYFKPSNNTPSDTVIADGFYVLGGYYIIPKSLQAILRYETFDPHVGREGNSTDVWTFGLNYYIKGDDLKLMANYLLGDHSGGQKDKQGRLLLRVQVVF